MTGREVAVRIRVEPEHYGVGYRGRLADGIDRPWRSAASFDDAVRLAAADCPAFGDPDGPPPRLGDLAVKVVSDADGRFLVEVTTAPAAG